MNRQDYLNAVKSQLEQNIFYHSLALEACMGGLFDYLKPNDDKNNWLMAGLLHDIDYSDPFKDQHPNKTAEVLKKYNLEISPEIINIIKAHSPTNSGVEPSTTAQWSIFCADSLTGLIVATALVYPSKKLADVKLSSVVKRFLKEPRFAAGTRREEVKLCEKPDGLNISLEKFIEICLTSMQSIAHEIGL
jgi:putative nucleotidyltransferase with HDIG domain